MPLCIPSLATFGVQRLILVNPCLFPCLQVVGHLLDDKVINLIMDLVVDGPCTFRVSDLKVGHVNEVHSSACTYPLVSLHVRMHSRLFYRMLCACTGDTS